jgi:hypothetical protein
MLFKRCYSDKKCFYKNCGLYVMLMCEDLEGGDGLLKESNYINVNVQYLVSSRNLNLKFQPVDVGLRCAGSD